MFFQRKEFWLNWVSTHVEYTSLVHQQNNFNTPVQATRANIFQLVLRLADISAAEAPSSKHVILFFIYSIFLFCMVYFLYICSSLRSPPTVIWASPTYSIINYFFLKFLLHLGRWFELQEFLFNKYNQGHTWKV